MIDPIVVTQCQIVLASCGRVAGQVVGMYVKRQQTRRDIIRAVLLVWCFLVSSALRA